MSAVEALADALYEDVPTLAGWQIDQVIECVVAAIRSMPAELKAEVVDGKVEGRFGFEISASLRSQTRFTRVVTPWLPLGVSPETNGE